MVVIDVNPSRARRSPTLDDKDDNANQDFQGQDHPHWMILVIPIPTKVAHHEAPHGLRNMANVSFVALDMCLGLDFGQRG